MNPAKISGELCLNEISQGILKLPSTLQNLHIIIDSLFDDKLPENWTLEYINQFDQPKLIINENDYQAFIQDALNQPVRPVKMKIIEKSQGGKNDIQNSHEGCLNLPEVEEAKLSDSLSPDKVQNKEPQKKDWWALEEKALENLKLVEKLKNQMEAILQRDSNGVMTSDLKTKVEKTEELLNLYEDFNRMPECAERSLLALKYLAARNKLSKETLPGLDLPPDFSCSQEFEVLENRFKLENKLSNQVKDLIKQCRIYAQNGDWKLTDKNLTALLNEVRSLDVPKILRLIAESDKARDLNANEDIFLLLGGTGSGKSTTMHFLGGSKMVLINDEGVHHIAPRDIKNPSLRKIHSSCKTRSETRFTVSVTVDPSHVKMETTEKKVLCDTPGFEDTEGAELDIANAVSIKRAISRCRSVRPILLVSYTNLGERYKWLKSLVETLVRMIPNVKEHVGSLVYFFTKYPEDKRGSISRSIKTVVGQLEEKGTELECVLKDMYEKTKCGPIIIDPLKDSEPGLILDDLMEKNDDLCIRRPGEVFDCAMGEKSEGVLQEQAYKYVMGIKEAFSRKDFKFAKYKFDELRSLQDVAKSRFLENALKNCKESLKECDAGISKEALEIANHYFGEENILDQDVIVKYQKLLEQSMVLKSLKEEYLEDGSSDFDLFKVLNDKVEALLQCIGKKEIHDPVIGQIFKKLRLLSNNFSGLKTKYQEARIQVEKEFETSCLEFLIQVNNHHDSEKIGGELMKVKEAIAILQEHIGKDLTTKYEGLRQAFFGTLKSCVSKAESQVTNSPTFDEKTFEIVRACIINLENLKNIESVRAHIQPQDILEKILEPLINTLKKYFEGLGKKIEEKIKEELSQEEKETFDVIQGLLTQMKIIRGLPKMQDETSRVYYGILEEIRSFLQKLKINLIEKISTIFRENDKTINVMRIKKNIGLLLDLIGWPEEIVKTLGNMNSDFKEKFLEEYKALSEILQGLMLSEENVEEIQKLDNLMISIKDQIACFETLFPDLKKNREEVEKIFDAQMGDLLSKIQKFVDELTNENQSDFAFRKAEKILQCLKICQRMHFKNVGADKISDKLQEFMFNHRKFLEKERIEQSYNTIKEYMQNFSNGSKEYFVNNSPNNSQNDMDISLNTTVTSKGSNGSTPKGISGQIKRELSRHKNLIRESIERIQEMQNTLSLKFTDLDIKKKWRETFKLDAEEFSEKMEVLRMTGNFRDLKLLIITMKVLGGLDEEFETEGLFGKIAKEFEEKLEKAIEERKREGFEEIEKVKTDYHELCIVIKDFTDSDDLVIQKQLSDIQKRLNSKVSKLIDETGKLLNCFRKKNITPEAAEKIGMSLKELEKVKNNVKEYLDANSMKLLMDFEAKMKSELNKDIFEFIEGIENSITNYCFKDAEDAENSLEIVQRELGEYLEEKTTDRIENLDKLTETVLEDFQKKFVNKTVDDFSKMALKRILPNFEPVNHDVKYMKVFETVSRDIFQAFEKELEQARNFKENDRSNPHFRLIDLTMSTLPKSIADDIKPHVEICKQDILELKKQQNSLSQIRVIKEDSMIQKVSNAKLAEIKQSEDPQKIAKLFEDCNIECWSSELDEMKIHLIGEIDKLRSEACEKLQSQQIREVQTFIVTLSQYMENLFQYCPEISEGNSVLQLMLYQVFDETLASYSKIFEKKKISQLEKALIEKAEADFLLLVDFMSLMQCPSTAYILDEEDFVKINSKIDNMVDETLRYFKFEETVRDLTASIEYADVSEINAILSSIKNLSHLFTTILNSSINTSQLNRIASNDKNVRNYGEMVRLLDKNLKEKSKIIEGYFDKFFNQGMNQTDIRTMNDAILNLLIITDNLDASHEKLLESKGFEDLQKSFTEKLDKFYFSILYAERIVEKIEEGKNILDSLPPDCVCNERFDTLIQKKKMELENLSKSFV